MVIYLKPSGQWILNQQKKYNFKIKILINFENYYKINFHNNF